MRAHLGFFELLTRISKSQVKAILNTLNKEQMNAICEALLNLRYGNIPLEDEDKRKLNRKRSVIRKLTSKAIGLKHCRLLLVKEISFYSICE